MLLERLALNCCVVVATAASLAHASDLIDPIDLSAYSRTDVVGEGTDDALESLPLVPAAYGVDAARTRIYASGIVGGSFATLTTGGAGAFGPATVSQAGSVNETIFTGGGALGVAFARQAGQLRMEIEGRARGPMSGVSTFDFAGTETPLDVTVNNGWSTLTNFWRDAYLTDALGLYAGGGFGVAGYQYSAASTIGLPLSSRSNVTTFAWQAGAGFIYNFNDRITLDTGYRFFAMTPGSAPGAISAPGFGSLNFGPFSNAFSASEFLVSIRIYEPFRNWQ